MPDGFISVDPAYYAQQFQAGQTSNAINQQDLIAKQMQNQQTQAMLNFWKNYSSGGTASPTAAGAALSGQPVTNGVDASGPMAGAPVPPTVPQPVSGASPGQAAAGQALQGANASAQQDPGMQMSAMGQNYMSMADKAMQSGAPALAMQFRAQAGEMLEKGASISMNTARAKNFAIDDAQKGLQMTGQIMNGVTDQASLDQARQQISQLPGIHQDALMYIPSVYTPDGVENFKNQTLTRQQQLAVHQEDIKNQMEKTAQENEQAQRQVANAHADAALAEDTRYHNLAGKNGALETIPKPEEVKQVQDAIVTQQYGGNTPMKTAGGEPLVDPALAAGAANLAGQAKAMVAKDRSLDWNTAVNTVVHQSIANGEWPALGKNDVAASEDNPNGVTYLKAGSRTQPLPPAPSPDKLIANRWYAPPGKPPALFLGKANGKLNFKAADGTLFSAPIP